MAQVLVLAWFNGAFMIHERLEYDPPVILNLKSDPAKPVTARIAYILGKYVVVETIKSEPS